MKGGTRDSSYWHPAMTANTNTSSYWLNWRALLCGVWVAIAIVLALKPILKYEGFRKKVDEEEEEEEEERVGSLYEDETWMTCLKGLHPAWLLSYRVFAFFVLLVTLVFTSIVDDANIYYFYTQWTFLLVTIYFGLGSLLSGHGCYKYYKRSSGDRVDNVEVDTEQANDVNIAPKGSNDELKCPETDDCCVRQRAGVWGYAFQIMFQMNAGAVLLTDCVFWCIIVPFLEINDYTLNALDINLHTINVVFLLGDTALNCLRFPCFRIAYFFLWTVAYVIFQWILHASLNLWWPYPFLDLSSSYAPLWYFTVAVLHIPCYGGYALVIKLKHHLLKRWFPQSYRCAA